ncbi:MAG TPA: ABC transporter permease, partial [Rubrivivax sp.]|nr:ABC transporter permease [Rubrivivax sp.]
MQRSLFLALIVREWRYHPWRHGVALLAVALGVALAYSVHLINSSALSEFSAAVRAANGEPDLTLRGPRAGFDDSIFERAAADAAVEIASPVLEIDTYAAAAGGSRVAVRVLGIDALLATPLAPALLPRPAAGEDRLAFLDPDAAFPNAAAREQLDLSDGVDLALRSGPHLQRLRVAGTVAAGGVPLVVMDLAGAQRHFGSLGRISRIDLRLVPGTDRAALLARLALPAGVDAVPADEAEQRVSQLSRAYRVNLTVLALVALFVGAFLVYSVVALSVAQRTPGFALLGAAGSALGLLGGTALAAAALRWLAGDLGGGYFPGITPALR